MGWTKNSRQQTKGHRVFQQSPKQLLLEFFLEGLLACNVCTLQTSALPCAHHLVRVSRNNTQYRDLDLQGLLAVLFLFANSNALRRVKRAGHNKTPRIQHPISGQMRNRSPEQ